MQPYIFPYIGYFQLINSVEKFVIYDDVNFIKQGWINRNNILLNGQRHLFTIPVENLTSFKKINETKISTHLYGKWLGKFEKTVQAAYRKAPFFDEVYPMVLKVLETGKVADNISSLCTASIRTICEYLEIDTVIEETSARYNNDDLNAYYRVLDICRREQADTYINAIGGQELYSKELFRNEGVDLLFLQSNDICYPQFDNEFVPHLSVIDLLMFNPKNSIGEFIQNFNLV